MNLFWAFRETNDSTYYNIAVNHALTTMKNHFREDNSCYHVVEYDTINGTVRSKMTHQGYSDESAWARGQAWALYGYTMCYRETGRPGIPATGGESGEIHLQQSDPAGRPDSLLGL